MFKIQTSSIWGALLCATLLTSGCGSTTSENDTDDDLADAGVLADGGNKHGDTSGSDAANNRSDSGANQHDDTSPPAEHKLKYSEQLLPEGTGISDLQPFIFEDTLYFALNIESLWFSDGTIDGTVAFKPKMHTKNIGVYNDMILFAGDDDWDYRTAKLRLWRSDGTTDGTVKVTEDGAVGGKFTELGGATYFFSHRRDALAQLWKTDGTDAGTVKVTDIDIGLGKSEVRDPTVVGDWLYFAVANTSTGLPQLWKTDGTAAGTQLVYKSGAGSGDRMMRDLTALEDRLVFRTYGALWVSDGTKDGTKLIAQLDDNPLTPSIQHLTSLGKVAVFSGHDGNEADGGHGREPWVTDGTAAGTKLLKDIAIAPTDRPVETTSLESSTPDNFFVHGNIAYFSTMTSNYTNTQVLYKTDGTVDGTVKVELEPAGNDKYEFDFRSMAVARGNLFIRCKVKEPLNHGMELCIHNGTPGGTRILEEIQPGEVGGEPTQMIATSDTLFYVARVQNAHKYTPNTKSLYALNLDAIE